MLGRPLEAALRKDLARSDQELPGMRRTAVGGSTNRLHHYNFPINLRVMIAFCQMKTALTPCKLNPSYKLQKSEAKQLANLPLTLRSKCKEEPASGSYCNEAEINCLSADEPPDYICKF